MDGDRMLSFGMETRRINDIVTRGAKTRISDKEFLKKEILKWLRSPKRRMQLNGVLYYDYEQEILKKKRMVLGEGGQLREDPRLPNTKIIDNQYAKMVDQKVNYLLANPITINSENKKYIQALKQVLNKSFNRLLKNLGKDSYNCGIGWLYPYYDENGEFKIKKFMPYEVLPFWKDDDHTELDFAARVYDVEDYEGVNEKTVTHVEVYDTNGIHKFILNGEALTPDYSTYYFENDEEGYNWDKVPLIPFKANNKESSLLKQCKSLQDALNEIMSMFVDGLKENLSGSSILIIKNYDGEDLGTFRHNLMTYKAVKVNTIDGADGGIDALKIEVDSNNYEVIVKELRKAIIQNCRGFNAEELKSSGSPNEMTIKSIYSDIDLDANEIETEYQAAFEQLLWFINFHLQNSKKGNFENEDVEIIFNRNMVVNETELIANVNASATLLSKKTCISHHPYVIDVEKELKQIDKEKNESMDSFGNAFFNAPKAGNDLSGDNKTLSGNDKTLRGDADEK
ncbi:phage portal protein, SPP1 family [Acetitomaculum ruminis DSM 5522]|uniref:Phage portal protein, SPP1 family n=1 Tax=Acetitomaculum ruminis DSM 5522 TaxID=1120918 RepID=A0A1I1AU52_9FIRM|nr:phage portal protein [Acetitomaculum ruminis]SFB39853.1 phage portal protein, SPP1 family [Acetitomaculum ruminis DSM 5522]